MTINELLEEESYDIKKGKIKCPYCDTTQSYTVDELPSKIYHGKAGTIRNECEKCGKQIILYTKNENDKNIFVSTKTDYTDYLKSLETPAEKKYKDDEKQKYDTWSSQRKKRMNK